MIQKILVADIGGTNARFSIAAIDSDAIAVEAPCAFRAADFRTIDEAVAAFLEQAPVRPDAACFAVAAPVGAPQIEFTNSPWVLDVEAMRRRLGVDRFLVVNDFAALAASVRRLETADVLRVKDGVADAAAPTLVIGPGSGLGQSLIVPCGSRDHIIATQGGHVGFAPGNDEEIAVLKILARDYGRVSAERLLSGPGLENIHRALGALAGEAENHLPADEITAASPETDPLAAKATAMFCAILGATAGDAALAAGAFGGVFLGGGILPKIREKLAKSEFASRFCAKGRMRALLEPVPVDLIVRDGAALLGAAALLAESGAQGRRG